MSAARFGQLSIFFPMWNEEEYLERAVNAATEIVNIENSLGQLQYRSFSPQQTKTEDSIEYHSTLVRSSQ